MENNLIIPDISKPKSRKYSQSINKLFGLSEEIYSDDDDLNDKEFDSLEAKKPISLEKLNVTISDLTEDKEALKGKKAKKSEGQPAAIKTFCRIRPTDSKNGKNLFKFNWNLFSF